MAEVKYRMVLEGLAGIKLPKSIKLSEFLKLYLEKHCKVENCPSTVVSKRGIINNILRRIPDKNITRITREDIKTNQRQRRREVAPATVNREIALIRNAFNLAIEWGYIESNPTARFPLLREPEGRVRYLTVDEIARLFGECPEWLRPIVITAIHTGMRRGEILELRWEDVDLEKCQITIPQEKTKTRKSRVVPVNGVLYNTLRSLGPKKGYVFTKKNGDRYREIKESFNAAVKRAGIEDFRFHDLRHTFASHLAMAGIPLETIGKLLGHKSPVMTWRYSHLSPDYMKDTVEVLHKINTELISSETQTS